MSELLDYYREQACRGRSTVPWLAALQEQAVDDLLRFGFPTRKDENWKYTLIDSFANQRFHPAATEHHAEACLPEDLPAGWTVNIHNGEVNCPSDALPAGLIVAPLLQAVSQHADKIKPWLGRLLQHEHAFQALNTAAISTGLLIYLPKDIKVELPIVISHAQDKEHQAMHVRHLIIAEEGAQATFIEVWDGEKTCCYFSNAVTEAHLAPGAALTHYKVIRESALAFHTGHLVVAQAEDSVFDSHTFSLGGKLVRSDVTFQLQGARAKCLLNGIYMPGDGQHVDHHTTVHHTVPDCQSVQDYKGVLSGHSRAVFNGRVVVAKNAQHTHAQQQNKNILLSSTAEIDTKPQLEIFADDVSCAHGATVGQLDEDALFYMMARGIERPEALRYLIQAFAADNLRLIAHADVMTWMANLINQQLR